MSKTRLFTCYECGDQFLQSALSERSLEGSHCSTKAEAIKLLPPYQVICAECADEWDDDDEELEYLEDVYWQD